MTVVVDAPQPARVDVAVDLRRRERGVPEQLLDRAQVGAAFEQVRRVRVPEPVRVAHQPAEHATCRARDRGRRGTARRSRRARARAARPGDTGRPRTPPARRAARRAPCRPCRARARASWSKSTSARRSPTTSALRRPHEYVSSRIAVFRIASGLVALRPRRAGPRRRRASARRAAGVACGAAARSPARARRRA